MVAYHLLRAWEVEYNVFRGLSCGVVFQDPWLATMPRLSFG
jgi:hypothetical protein